jgi:hypothetical protein
MSNQLNSCLERGGGGIRCYWVNFLVCVRGSTEILQYTVRCTISEKYSNLFKYLMMVYYLFDNIFVLTRHKNVAKLDPELTELPDLDQDFGSLIRIRKKYFRIHNTYK